MRQVVVGSLVSMLLATGSVWSQQPQMELESAESGEDTSIFDSLQIDLMDIQRLREEIESTLVGEPMRISLQDCVRLALENNQDILIVGYERALAESDLLAARGDFDPTLSTEASYSDSSTPANPTTASFLGGTADNIEQRLADLTLSLGGLTPIGTEYSAEFLFNRERGTFTTPRDPMTGMPLDTQTIISGDIALTLTQPLLRGLGFDTNLVRVRTAKNNIDIADEQVKLTLLNTLGDVIKAYWELVGAIEQVRVQQESLDNARRVLRINEQRYELGTAAALEVLQAKAGVASRQGDLVNARTAVLDAEDRLKNLLGLYDDDNALLSNVSLVPIDRPNVQAVHWDLEESMQIALSNRPDIRSAELNVENADLEVRARRDDLMPQLDLTGRFSRSTVNIDLGDTIEGLRDKDGRTYTVSITGSIPIGNRAARGSFTRAKLARKQEEQRLRKAELDAMLNVRLAIHSIASNQILVESTEQARILEEANVAAEEKRLRIGVTTAQDVLDIQEDLTIAQAQEIAAQVEFEQSLIDLRVAEGTLLEEMGILFDGVDADTVDPGFFRSLGRVNIDN